MYITNVVFFAKFYSNFHIKFLCIWPFYFLIMNDNSYMYICICYKNIKRGITKLKLLLSSSYTYDKIQPTIQPAIQNQYLNTIVMYICT